MATQTASRSRSVPGAAIPVGLWVVAVAVLITAFALDDTVLKVVGGLGAVAYAVALVVWLARTPDPEPPETTAVAGRRLGFGARLVLCVGGVVLLLGLGLMIGTAVSLIGASAAIAAVVVAVRHREVTRRDLGWGLAIGLTGAGTIVVVGNGDLAWAGFVLVTTPVLFVAGVVLRRRAHVGEVHVVAGRYRRAVAGLGVGATLAIPPALFNLLGGFGSTDAWVRHWWQPIAAIEPAIVEQTWAALFLVTLTFLVLSVGGRRRALVVAVVLSALIHGFAHSGIDPIGIVIGSLLFTVPSGFLFARRDLEHAVGYHAVIDAVRFTAAYLG